MERPTCKTCVHWVTGIHRLKDLAMGECRASLPCFPMTKSLAEISGPSRGWWPETHEDDGCAEHPDIGYWLIERDRLENKDEEELTMTRRQFADRLFREADGQRLLNLLDSGEEWLRCRNAGLIKDSLDVDRKIQIVVPSWKALLAHLRALLAD
jgi:hypothetical protein